jgi:gamma-glutamylcyclotransferase (GGCT)/AIG2-like uncharacterized protein YtfP
MHRVFVYGTLKSGLENHGLLTGSVFVGRAYTVGHYRMLDGRFPVLLDSGLDRHVIDGELYDVDDATLTQLDDLESLVEGIYDRVEIDIIISKEGSPAGADRAFAYIGCDGYWDRQARPAFTALTPGGHLDWTPSRNNHAKVDPE